MGAKFETMILRLRPVLTILLLLLFSLENVANGAMDVCSEKNQNLHHLSAQKENLTLFSFIIEENESEERTDDKANGHTLHLGSTRHTSLICSSIFKAGHLLPWHSRVPNNQQLLKLICRLSI